MADRPPRRTRVTIRCLCEDLQLELPTLDVDLGAVRHPLITEARRVAPTAPSGQKRILAITYPLVYRLRHGRWRGATWLESDAGRFWLLAGAQREAGSREDAYAVFVALHDSGALLPTDDDRLRDDLERNARVLAAASTEIPEALKRASALRDQDVIINLVGLISVRLLVSSTGDEVWVAVSTLAADGRFVEERLRDLLFVTVFDFASAEVSEPRADWPSGTLEWFEVARLGLRDPIQ